METYLTSKNQINSVYPPWGYLTWGPWIYMVPQYKPESVLMLGYAGGTTAGLIRLFYDMVPITAVDINFIDNRYGVNFVMSDAKEYIQTCPSFDTVIVDVFNGAEVCDFVCSSGFVEDLTRKSNFLIVHVYEDTDMGAYQHLKPIKVLSLDEHRFYYFVINRVPSLPIR